MIKYAKLEVMRKIFFISFLLFVSVLFHPSYSKAICYSLGDDGYASCIGNRNAKKCQHPSGTYYACCNEVSDICLFDPNRNNILENTPCGGTSQRCCSSKKCNDSLTCTVTYGGEYCLDQGQINALKSGGSTNTKTESENSALCKDPSGKEIGINTALGCLYAGDPPKMISQLLGWGTIVGGGIAFLMIVLAGFQITMAGGDPKKVQAARELITSAITGLILIIFSVFLINLIGVDILGLKGLGF
jgi:hypothetical protein